MSKSIIKRIQKIEKTSRQPRWLATIFDESTQLYSGDDIGGKPLTPEQFGEWQAKQDPDTQIIIVRVEANKPEIEIKNYASLNTEDMLKAYDEVIMRETSKETKRRVDELICEVEEAEAAGVNGVEST